MRVMHPKAVADQISGLVEEVQRGLASVGTLDRPSTGVGPQPCDHVDGTRPIRSPDGADGRNPYEDPWYVDYSPFTMLYIGHVDVESAGDLAPALTGLRDHLVTAGWRPREVQLEPRPGEDHARLVIEAPADGFGLRAVGIVTTTGRPRIITYCSSPCFQHPDEIRRSRAGRD
jgi:hypothetical protein